MKKVVLLAFLFVHISELSFSQKYTPKIETCPCLMKVDARLKVICGNLIVPENRQKPDKNSIKIPFVFARKPEQDSSKNITLFTTGGPGYTTIPVDDSVRFNSGYLDFGGFIYFNQRGSKNASPCLDCDGINEAVREAYRKNLPKDSLIAIAADKCRKKFEKQGIDLSSYTTMESAADIADLRKALKIDSLTLFGGSYSGGLMLTVARLFPEGISSIIIGSPLPTNVNYEEHALFNHNEALETLFAGIEADSSKRVLYPNLKQGFRDYFSQLDGVKFSMKYFDPIKNDSIDLIYSKNELLDAVFNRMNNSNFREVPQVILDLISGRHEKHIVGVMNAKFYGDNSISFGMRYSIYCSEQIAFSDIKLIKKQDEIVPWLAGYPFNSPTHEICACWNVKPVPVFMKTPVYSTIPVLISAGEFDPWTRPFYNQLIKRTMPNAQILTIKERAHMAGFGGRQFVEIFYRNPYQKLVSDMENVKVE